MAVGISLPPATVQSSKTSTTTSGIAQQADTCCHSDRAQKNRNASLARPFFWEVVPLCDLYTLVNVVVLPSLGSTTSGTGASGQSDSSTITPSPAELLGQALYYAGIDLAEANSTPSVLLFTIILPSTNGYVNRADFFRLRLQDIPYAITKVHEPLLPLQYYNAALPSSNLPDLVRNAGAIIQWEKLSSSVTINKLQGVLARRTEELRYRLNGAQFLSPEPIQRKRVALIRGRPNLTAGSPIYRAASALGLDLVIVDEQGHWLQADTDENKKYREAFLVTDMTEDESVADRIVSSIKSYPLPIHGVFTVSDNFFVVVARVAEKLGLPANPVSAFETSVDKYRSRLAQDTPGQTARVHSVGELESMLSSSVGDDQRPAFSPTYPLIVKPTKGWSSECVSKVTKPEDLALAVEKATRRHGSAAVIEPFFDGPEMDANFILLDGEILFSEIADEPPCDGDAKNATVDATFSPEALTMPSRLPIEEQDIVKSTLRDILVKIGFRTGVFHVEARMVNSAVEYRNHNGVVDLARKDTLPVSKPECRLIEINARPPGYRVSVPIKQTYGVDYFAAHMLAAAGERDRLKLVAQPFNYTTDTNIDARNPDAQYWSRLVYVPAPAAGVVQWKRSDLPPCEELKLRRPDLAKHIVLGVDYCTPGDKVELYTDGARTYVAHLLVSSRVSREEAIAIGNEVQRSFEIDIVPDQSTEHAADPIMLSSCSQAVVPTKALDTSECSLTLLELTPTSLHK
ncbi:carnosine synthase 1 [Naviculisporaceae sp. PSN 640]